MSASLGEWDETQEAGDETVTPHDEPGDAEPDPPLYFQTVDEFVREIIVQLYRRQVGPHAPHRWAAAWWRSGEAIMRLEALWRAWEHLRHDGALGMSTWLRDHADHHMPILLDPESGPFKKSKDTNNAGEPLPYEAAPDGLFVPV